MNEFLLFYAILVFQFNGSNKTEYIVDSRKFMSEDKCEIHSRKQLHNAVAAARKDSVNLAYSYCQEVGPVLNRKIIIDIIEK